MQAHKISIGPYSDHVLLKSDWIILGWRSQSRIWRLDNFLFINKEVVDQVQKEISLFFLMNGGTSDKNYLMGDI